MAYGYHGAVLHIDLTSLTTRVEQPSENTYRLYGGGGLLGTHYLLQHTPAGIDPLGAENILVFANSVVAGFPAAGLVRYVVTTKSPLSNGIGETRGEGPWAVALKHSGYDALVIHGAASAPVSLVIEDGIPRLVPAADLWGKTVGETTDILTETYDRAVDVAAIGPAGEAMVRYASIVTNRTHQAQRHGVGAVMGSKKLKAIVIIGGKLPPVAHPDKLAALNAHFAQAMKQNTLSMWQKDLPGFAVWVHTHGLDAALNTENYRTAQFAFLEQYKAATWMPFFQRNAKCPGCPNDCIKIYHNHDADLDMRAGGMHQEVSGTMGPNIGTQHPRTVMRYNNLCNQYGLDPVSLGFTLSFAMEAHANGVLTTAAMDGINLTFGDSAATEAMITQIVARTGFGAILAEGSERAAASIGAQATPYAMHVKGVELVPFEPRSQSNLALGYATAPIGPRYDICEHDWDFDTQVGWDHSLDHARTLGIVDRIPMEYVGPEKVRNYKALHTLWSGADALAFCIFAIAPTRVLSLQLMTEMLAAVTGWETSSYEILRFGERRTHLMQVYNRREGLTAAGDTLPERFFVDPIDSGAKAGVKLDRAAFMAEIALYYEMMGWDEHGTPRPATLYDHHLEWALPQLAAITRPQRAAAAPTPVPVSEPIAVPPPVQPPRARERVVSVPAPKPTPTRKPTLAAQTVPARPATTESRTTATPTDVASVTPVATAPSADKTPPPPTPAADPVAVVATLEPAAPEPIAAAASADEDVTTAATAAVRTPEAPQPTQDIVVPPPEAVAATPELTAPEPIAAAASAEADQTPAMPQVDDAAITASVETPEPIAPVLTEPDAAAPPLHHELLTTLLSESPKEPVSTQPTPADVFLPAAAEVPSEHVQTSGLTPELYELHTAAKANAAAESIAPTTPPPAAQSEEPTDEQRQPQTQLPPPAIKQHQARALGIPAPVEPPSVPAEPAAAEPTESPHTEPPTPEKPKTGPRSIAKRLSLQELLNAEMPSHNPRPEE